MLRRGPLLVAAAAALWGLWSTCFKAAEARSSIPLGARLETFLVFAVMLALTLPFAVRDARRAPHTRPARAWALLLLLGVTDAVGCLCFFLALQKTTIAIAVLTHYMQPLLTALAAPMFVAGERWRARTFAALGVASCGLLLLLEPWAAASAARGSFAGAALGLTSAFLFAATVILGKRATSSSSFSPLEVASFPKLTAVPLLALAAAPAGFAVEPAPFAVVLVGGAVLGAAALVIFYRGLASTPASQAGVLTLCEPFVAVVVGALLWDEVPGPLAALGGALVLAGAAAIALDTGAARRAVR